MKSGVLVFALFGAFALVAEKQPFERYQPILDRQMFGQPPAGFDPTRPPNEVSKSEQRELTKEQEVLKSSIHFSVINVTPEGQTAVGFTDNSDPKSPVHYYLKVGEERNGWKVVEADPVTASMRIVKGDIEVSLELGANSAKGGATMRTGPAAAQQLGANGIAAGVRTGLLGLRRSPLAGAAPAASDASSRFASLRERRAAREQERAAAAEKQRAEQEAERAKLEAEKAKAEAEREEQRRNLQELQDQFEKIRADRAAEKAKAEEARTQAESESEKPQQAGENANDES